MHKQTFNATFQLVFQLFASAEIQGMQGQMVFLADAHIFCNRVGEQLIRYAIGQDGETAYLRVFPAVFV